ncbi:MAG: N-acetylmuramoyl-L-alanine amidase [Candidatus Eremiobacterota bacterium]
MRIKFVLLLALLFGSVAVPASAQTAYERMIFQGHELRPTVSVVNGRTVLDLGDPTVQRLVDLASARLQWSSTGQTLYVYAPGRESYWTLDSAQVTVNGQEAAAPGRLFARGQATVIEPAALLHALSLTAVPGQEGTLLLPVLNDLTFSDGNYPTVTIRASAPLRYRTEKPEAGVVVLRFEDLLWGGSQRSFTRGSLSVEVQGGTRAGESLTLRLSMPPAWDGDLKPGTFRNELSVAPVPSSQLVGSGPPVRLQRVDYRRIEGDDMVIFFAEAPVRFSWDFDPASRLLSMEFPGVMMDPLPALLETPGAPLSQARLQMAMADQVPVLRFEGRLAPDHAFEFFEIEGTRGSLVLRLAPTGKLPALENRGTASTTGYVASGRGVIVIDAGHGGGDPGCYSRSEGVYEKDITLDIARRLRDVLQRQGWKVVMTRETDRDVTYAGSPDKMELQARCDVANNIGADLFVSIHCNASPSSAHYGTSIHWYKEEDYEFARSLEFVLGESIGLGQKGLIRNSFYVLRHTEMPAVLVETAYLTHPGEASMLVQPQFRQKVAERLAGGLSQFMSGRYARAPLP